MPNNTDVRIYIDHASKARIDDMENIFSNDYPFDKIIPIPDHIFRGNLGQAEREKYGTDNWYDWCIANWNTKWDAYNVRVQRLSDTSLYVICETAWNPPIPIFEKLVELGFEVSACYLDEGWNYIGEFDEGEASFLDVDKNVPSHLIDEFNIEFELEETSNDE